MTLQTAILESSREVLRELLAPELADKLATRVVERAQSRIDEAIGEFFGFEAQREGARRKPGRPRSAGRTRPGDDSVDDEGLDAPEATEPAEAA